MHVTTRGPVDGPPVLLIHGNCASSGFWEPLLRHLPQDWRIVAPDLRGYGASPALGVDATRGVRDFADDIAPLLTAFDHKPVVIGHSLGGGVAMQLLLEHPESIAALVLEAPVSPYGFGGTRDLTGTPTTPDFAGTGGGSANPDFVRLLAAKDRGTDEQASPRNVMRAFYVALALRPRPAGQGRPGPRLARRGSVPAAADDRADEGGAGGVRAVHRNRPRRLRSLPARGTRHRLRRRTGEGGRVRLA